MAPRSAADGSASCRTRDAGGDGRGRRLPEAAGGWADFVLRQDRAGAWFYESLSGEAMPSWLERALARRGDRPRCRIEWSDAGRDTHRAGGLACLDAIAA